MVMMRRSLNLGGTKALGKIGEGMEHGGKVRGSAAAIRMYGSQKTFGRMVIMGPSITPQAPEAPQRSLGAGNGGVPTIVVTTQAARVRGRNGTAKDTQPKALPAVGGRTRSCIGDQVRQHDANSFQSSGTWWLHCESHP